MLIVVIAGLLVGLVMGALGGGGAIMTMPLLTLALGLPPTHATVGSLVVVISGAISGLVSHLRRRHIRPGIGVVFGALGTGGAVLAANVSGLLDDAVLLTLFSALLVIVAATMIVKNTRRRSPRPSSNHDGPENRPAWSDPRSWLPLILTATVVGFLTGLFGVGGGFLIVPALTMVFGMDMRRAIGTSLVAILVTSLVALSLHASVLPHLEWDVVGPFAGAAVVGSALGARMGHRINTRLLSLGFAGLLVLTGCYTALQSVPRLLG